MANFIDTDHSHDFLANGVPQELIETSRRITDLTQNILRDSQMALSATLSASSTSERIILTGILTNGIIYGVILPNKSQVLYNVRLLGVKLDQDLFRANLVKHLQT